MNLTPDFYTQAEHLAIRMGFSPSFPFEAFWGLPPSNYSATHSILLGSWVEGGVFACSYRLRFSSPASGFSGTTRGSGGGRRSA